jgi:IS30 family transposase
MVQIGRPRLSFAQKKELWRRWKQGQSLSEIARALGKHAGSIHGVLQANGGIVPLPRSRGVRVLSLSDREEISRGLAQAASIRTITAQIGRAPSSVSREITRHGGRSKYRATTADDRAWQSTKRPKIYPLAANPALRQVVASKLKEDWSPQQIAGWLIIEYPEDQRMRMSHERICRSLFL